MEKSIQVKDNFRKNPDSLIPGGSVVETISSEGLRLVYDKVKNPSAYIKRIIKDEKIVQIFVDGELFWEKE
jgi:hypothetical protein